MSAVTDRVRRALDVAVSGTLLLAAAPVLGVLALAVRATSPGPAFFRQERVGREGRPFRLLKLRTMVADAAARGGVLTAPGDARVTRLGAVLRRWKLDELPQLLNVLRGDMSLVGPRPEQVELVARYSPEHRVRLAVKAGLTGPMQVFGRGELTFEERLAVEREYVETISLRRDLRIMTMTLSAIVSRRGAS